MPGPHTGCLLAASSRVSIFTEKASIGAFQQLGGRLHGKSCHISDAADAALPGL